MTVRKGSRLFAAADFAFSSTSSSIDSVVLMVDLRRQESRDHHSITDDDVKASSPGSPGDGGSRTLANKKAITLAHLVQQQGGQLYGSQSGPPRTSACCSNQPPLL